MYNTTFNLIAVSLFLCASLFLGLWAGRGVKTMRDYAIANKNLFVGALMATMVATLFNTESIDITLYYSAGLSSFLHLIVFVFSTFCVGAFIMPSLVHFKQELTLPDMMRTFYGKSVEYVTAIIAIVCSVGVIITQLVHFSELSELMGISPKGVILMIGTVTTLYTFRGGIRSVAKTDVLQVLVIVIGFFVFFLITGAQYNLNDIVQATHIQTPGPLFPAIKESFTKIAANAFFWSLLPTILISPPIVQRVLMSPNKKMIKQMFLSFVFVYVVLNFLSFGIGLKAILKLGKADDFEKLTDLLLINALCSPIGKTIYLLVVCAVAVSTMDSFLNAAAIIFVHNVVKPSSKDTTEQKIVEKTCFASLALGLVCTIISIFSQPLGFVYMGYVIVVFSCLSIPFLMSCMGLQSSSKAFFASFISYFAILFTVALLCFARIPFFVNVAYYISTEILNASAKSASILYSIDPALNGFRFFVSIRCAWYIAFFPSLIVFFVVCYIENRGFVFVNYEQDSWRERKHTFTSHFERSFTMGNPALVGYVTMAFTLATALIGYKNLQVNEMLLMFLRLVPFVLSFAIMTQGHWTDRLKPYFNKVYHVTLWYCWAFLPAFLAIADPQIASIFYAVAGIIFLGIQTTSTVFIAFSATGMAVATCISKMLTGFFLPDLGVYADWLFIFCVASFFVVMTIFRKLHQEKERMEALMVNFKIAKGELLLSHETNSTQVYDALHEKHAMMKEMQKCIDRLQSKEVDKDILEKLEDIMGYYNYIGESSSSYLNIVIEKHPLENLLNDAREIITYETLPLGKLTLHNESSASIVVGDSFQIKNLIANALHIFADVYPDTDVNCFVNDVYLDYEVPAIYKKEPEKAIRFIFTNNQEKCNASGQDYRPYDSNTKIETLNHIGVLENKRITRAHYGFLSIEKEGDTLIQTYVIPVNLKNIRPKIDRYVVEDLRDLEQIESDIDKGFLRLAEEHGLDKDHIREALKVAKHYHYHQKRKSGESYYLHPLAVATILLENKDVIQVDQGMLEDLVIAALLHDIFEDTPYTSKQLRTMFGNNVAEIVKQVSHLYNRANRPKVKVGKMETLHALVQNGNEYAMLIKVLDRLHNMRTLGAKESDRQLAIAEETKVLFIPMARRLGMQRVANELTVLVEEILGK